MSEILEANIFFFIASVGVIIFITLVAAALYQVIVILQAIRRIIDRIDAGSETIAEDVAQLRTYVVGGSLFSQIMGFFMNTKKAATRRRRNTDE